MNIPAGPWYIDDALTFTATTHRFDTGALTDADSVPSYRVYEDETGTAILTGSMAKLDDANTIGFYSEQITLSAANGFEAGKSYSVYISAAVNSVTGGQSGGFKVIATPFAAADVWSVGTRLLTAGTNIALAKGTGVTGFNDLSAAQVNAEADTALADYDGPTHAELTAAIAAGDDATLSAIAALNNLSAAQVRTELSTELGRIDVANSTRMASYTQPTGFLAATFPSDPADQSLVIAATDAVMARLGAPAGGSVSADVAAVKLDSAAILTDTGTTLDGKIDAIKAKTDQLIFTKANELDVNIQSVNGVTVTGNGAGAPWGP